MSEVKRKDLARPYKAPPALSPEHLPPDYMALISLIFGLLGMIAKVKIASWLAVYACISSLANVKKSEVDIKQTMCSVAFAFMGLYSNYFRYGLA